jgi:hypothetical protein
MISGLLVNDEETLLDIGECYPNHQVIVHVDMGVHGIKRNPG